MKILEITFELRLFGKAEALWRSHPNSCFGRLVSMLKWMCSGDEQVGTVKVKEKDG